TKSDSAFALSKKARALGMVPAGDPARLVVGSHGKVTLIGQPHRADPTRPPPSTRTADATPPPAHPRATAAVGPNGAPREGDPLPQGGVNAVSSHARAAPKPATGHPAPTHPAISGHH
ncbi:MAG: hypothetical protein ACRDRL_23970, partial [Sciscionella sp.]